MGAKSVAIPRNRALYSPVVWTLLILLIIGAAGEMVLRGFWRAPSDLQDFAILYASARAFDSGKNPYDPSELHAASVAAGHMEAADPSPQNLAVYLPTTYLLLSPVAALPWANARWAWLLIDFIAVAVIIFTLLHYAPIEAERWKMACCAAFVLGFGPIQTALAKGQLVVVITALLALAFAAEARTALVASGIFVGLAASIKPQVVIPVVLLYLLNRRWKTIAVVAAVSATLLAIGSLRLYLAGVPWISSLLQNISREMQPSGVYDPSPSNPLSFQLVNASPFLHSLTSNQTIIGAILLVLGLSVTFLLWQRVKQQSDVRLEPGALAAAFALGLALLSQRYYDASVLVFVFTWALATASARSYMPQLIAIAGCLVMAFPIPALLATLGHRQAPGPVPQVLWDAVIMHQQSWIVLVILGAVVVTFRLREAAPVPNLQRS